MLYLKCSNSKNIKYPDNKHAIYIKDLEKLPVPIDHPIDPYGDKGYTFDLSLRNA